MSLETHETGAAEPVAHGYEEHAEHDDGRLPLALAAGLVAALVAGAAWAGLAFLTNREIGYVAWGVGLLVGFAMSRVTARRTQTLAMAAAFLALVGLAAGKVFIYAFSANTVAEQFESDDLLLSGALAWQLYEARELAPETLAQVDALQAAGDTLPDAVWEQMRSEAGEQLRQLSDEERHELAVATSRGVLDNMGIVGGIRAQLSLFDLLWVFLAVGTAFRMLAPDRTLPAPEPAATA